MVERQTSFGISTRIISYKTGQYLTGIVGIDSWLNFAIALRAYADCKPTTSSGDTTSSAVYLMLMGYALEDLAKCIIAYKAYTPEITDVTTFEEKMEKLEFIRDDNKKCKLKTHKLEDLYRAKDLGFPVDNSEIDHLKIIGVYTLWKGRYPVPLELAKMLPSGEPSFEELSRTAISIYDRAMKEVERLRSSRS